MGCLAFRLYSSDGHHAGSCFAVSVMAFLTGNLLMPACERVGRAGMAESRSRLPGFLTVTAQAVGAELILMRLPVARHTLASETKEGPVEIFQLDFRTGCGCNPGCGMATLALLPAMLPFQSEACLGPMIEVFPVQSDEGEFRAAMFNVAARTILLADGTIVGPRVKALLAVHSALDLKMTFQAFETPRSKIVAGCALGNTLQVRMYRRQKARGNLRLGDNDAEHAHKYTRGRNVRTPGRLSGSRKNTFSVSPDKRNPAGLIQMSCQ